MYNRTLNNLMEIPEENLEKNLTRNWNNTARKLCKWYEQKLKNFIYVYSTETGVI